MSAWLFKIMRCNRFIGETLVRTYWLSDESVVLAASAMYQEQVPSCKHLDEPLDEGRFVFECVLARNLQAFTTCRTQLSCSRDCAFVWLSIFPGNSVSCYKINCLFLVTPTERFHSWYCAKLDQPKIN